MAIVFWNANVAEVTDVSEECSAFIFRHPENKGSTPLRIVNKICQTTRSHISKDSNLSERSFFKFFVKLKLIFKDSTKN
jgi:hypothetical protein